MKRVAIPVLVSIVGVALLGLLIYGVTHQAASRSLDEALHHNEHPPAPDASHALPALDGHGGDSLAAYAGQVVVLNFWASWCEPCQTEAPLLESAQPELLRHRATVLGVTYKDASPDSLAFVHRYDLTYPNLRDASGEFAGSYGTDQLPETFVIDRHGRVVAISRGEIERPFLARALKLAESS